MGEARLPEELEELAKRYTVGEGISFTVEVDVYPVCPMEEATYKGLEVDVERYGPVRGAVPLAHLLVQPVPVGQALGVEDVLPPSPPSGLGSAR